MEIWRTDTGEWIKDATDPFPLPGRETLLGWLNKRNFAELSKGKSSQEYWIVFSLEEQEAIEALCRPINGAPADIFLEQHLEHLHSFSITYVSANRPYESLKSGQDARLAIHVVRQNP